ncbi:MAG: T9SS type A sorting domain-containing protein [Chlorobi bacterium]|nr:T9SS type A sorting domain-containing protein [Chlorobiota bacterium]
MVFLVPLILVSQNQNLSNGVVFDGEPYLAINPANPQNIVVAWMSWKWQQKIVIKTTASFDRGSTWSEPVFIPHASPNYGSGDPSMVFDELGNLFLFYVDYRTDPDSGAVYVVKSTDGGLSWGEPLEVINGFADGTKEPVDRPWSAIDLSGNSGGGNIYVTTQPAPWINPPNRPYFIRSTNHGATWDDWKYVDTTGWLVGNTIQSPMAAPAVSEDGTFYCIYPSYLFSQSPYARYLLAASSDGGNTFEYHEVMKITSSIDEPLAKKGYVLIADPSDVNHLLFCYPIAPFGDADVYITESYDNGVNWTDHIRVNDDPQGNGILQDLVWADFDNEGNVIVNWRDRRNSGEPGYETSYEIWGAYRSKDSASFSPNFRISDTLIAYDDVLANSGNDFLCVKLRNDTMYSVWGDTRTGTLNIWFQRMKVPADNINSIYHQATKTTPAIEIFPNPAYSQITVRGKDMQELIITAEDGKILFRKTIYSRSETVDITSYPVGMYLLKVKTKTGVAVKKFIVNHSAE